MLPRADNASPPIGTIVLGDDLSGIRGKKACS